MASDPIAALEAVDGETFVQQYLECVQTGRPGPDDAVATWLHAAQYRALTALEARASWLRQP